MNKLIDLMDVSEELFLKITDIGVIAGSAALYAATDIRKDLIGDVDIYVQNIDDFLTIAKLLCNAFDVHMEIYDRWENCGYGEPDWEIFSLINMTRKNGIMLQLIGMDVNDPSDYIKSFDFDYVKCYFHKRELYISPVAASCHESKIITIDPSKMYSRSRLDKVYQKGFRFSDEHIPLYNRNFRQKDITLIHVSDIEYLVGLLSHESYADIIHIEYKIREKEDYYYPYLRAAFYDIDIIPEIINIMEDYLWWDNKVYLTDDDFGEVNYERRDSDSEDMDTPIDDDYIHY